MATPETALKKAVAAVEKAIADKKKKDEAAKAAAATLKVGDFVAVVQRSLSGSVR